MRPVQSLLTLAVAGIITTVGLPAGAQLIEPGEAPNLNTSVTQNDIAAGNLSLLDIIEEGKLVFSTPFNRYDGLGDGPVNSADTLSPGGRPTLQANPAHGNGYFLRLNGLDSQTCLECHSILSNKTIPALFEVGGVGGVATNAIAAPTKVDPADTIGIDHATFNGRFINPPFVFGSGGIELLAKEMTSDLQKIKDIAKNFPGQWRTLETHGVSFGSIRWVIGPALAIKGYTGNTGNNCSPLKSISQNGSGQEEADFRRFIAINEAPQEFASLETTDDRRQTTDDRRQTKNRGSLHRPTATATDSGYVQGQGYRWRPGRSPIWPQGQQCHHPRLRLWGDALPLWHGAGRGRGRQQ